MKKRIVLPSTLVLRRNVTQRRNPSLPRFALKPLGSLVASGAAVVAHRALATYAPKYQLWGRGGLAAASLIVPSPAFGGACFYGLFTGVLEQTQVTGFVQGLAASVGLK